LSEGIDLELDDQMLEEFKYHLECFLGEVFEEYSFLNDGDNTLEISHLNEDILYLHFVGGFFSVTIPHGVDISDPRTQSQVGYLAKACLGFWEAFEKEIPNIQQSFL
jgi:hypothetical protein